MVRQASRVRTAWTISASQARREGRTWPERVAIGQADQGARLGAQRVDHVAVVDDVATPPLGPGAAARQGQQMRAAEIGLEPVVVDAQPQALADQAGGHGVEDAGGR